MRLAHAAGESLESRAQAKRIANRLDAFDTVDLDFDGVDAIGQGFADELFRVFARQHPKVRLQPRNMNAQVAAMVAQVTVEPSDQWAKPLVDALERAPSGALEPFVVDARGAFLFPGLAPQPSASGPVFAFDVDDQNVDRLGRAAQHLDTDAGDFFDQFLLLRQGAAFEHFNVVGGHGGVLCCG